MQQATKFVKSIFKRRIVKKHPPYHHVTQIGNPVLRNVCQPIDKNEISSDKIQDILLQMKKVLNRYNLFGLSAPQVGVPLRLFVIGCTRPEDDFSKDKIKKLEMESFPCMVWINPEIKILDYKNITTEFEACASVTGLQAKVPRYHSIELTGLNENGEENSWTTKGWTARIIQHEMDHLEGTMFTDVMVPKSLECPNWHGINDVNGLMELKYYA